MTDDRKLLQEAVQVINELLLAHSKEGGEIDRRLSWADGSKFVQRLEREHGIR